VEDASPVLVLVKLYGTLLADKEPVQAPATKERDFAARRIMARMKYSLLIVSSSSSPRLRQ
jgi:hypothetical protein